jgi:hypothetical protein
MFIARSEYGLSSPLDRVLFLELTISRLTDRGIK